MVFNKNENDKQYIGGNILNLPLYKTELNSDNKLQSPWKSTQTISNMFMHRTLFATDSTLINISPDLAISHKVSDDRKTYTIVLDEDNYWSDGEKVTADDIIFSIKATLRGEQVDHIFYTVMGYIVGASDYREGKTEEISGIYVDGNTITFELITIYNTFLPVLAQLTIVPYHVLKDEDLFRLHNNDFWKNPVVSGMYKFDEIVIDEEKDEYYFKLIQNEYYSKEKSDIEEIRLHTNFNKKILDYYATTNINEIMTYSNTKDYDRYDAEMLMYRYFIFNINGDDGNYNEVMDNVGIRKGIMTAIDREKILNSVYLGVGEIINSGISNSSEYNNGFTHEYNPTKAKELLEDAGYDFERTFTIGYSIEDTQTSNLLGYVQSDLEEIGLDVELIFVPTEFDKYVIRDFDLLLYDYTAFNENAWYSEYDEFNNNHKSLFHKDKEFQGLFAELRESETEEIRAERFRYLQQLEQEMLYILPMFSLNQAVYIYDKRLNVPSNIEFGNSWYRYDIQLEKWSVKKD